MKTSLRCTTVLLVTVAVAAVTHAAPALAAPPSNDTEAGAVVIDAVPFTNSADTSEATPDGPGFCSNNTSVFYRFTPAEDARIQIDLIGSDYDTTLGIYRRDTEGRVEPLKCNDDRFGLASGVRLRARPGMTYYVMVGECCGNGRAGGGGHLALTVSKVVPLAIEMTVQISETGTVDIGMATISGTVTCNQRTSLYADGTLRQLREDLYVARGSFWTRVGCTPEAPASWSVEVDTETAIAFGTGSAAFRMTSYASDGWDSVDLGRSDVTIQLLNA